jgi:hypothetical protein
VADDAVLELLIVGAEDEVVLLGGHVPVRAGGDQIPGGPKVHPLGEGVQDLSRGRGACSIVDDEDDVLPSFEEVVHGGVSDRVVDGLADDLVRVSALHVLGVERADIVLVGDLDFLDPVLAVLHINDHVDRWTDCRLFYLRLLRTEDCPARRTSPSSDIGPGATYIPGVRSAV